MAERIGGESHVRIYIEEWMAAARPALDRKRLAKKMGVAPSTITKKLAAPGKIDLEWLEMFRFALGLSNVTDLFQHPNATKFDEIFSKLSDDDKSKVIEYAQLLGAKSH